MSKKYLSIEEAAAHIGVSTAELNRLREKGTIRAFADRGTWKFKEEDVEKLSRSRQADSDPDVPLPSFEPATGDSAADLVFSDEDALGNQPTIIRKGSDEAGSDSDVRLIFDDSMSVPAPKAGVAPEDSDSDVKLAGGLSGVKDTGSDSDVKLVTDVEPTEASGSDSDVRLVSSDSSSEVQLATGPGSGVKAGGVADSAMYPGSKKDEGSSLNLAPSGEDVLDDDSGISLAEGSGIALASDSGISLEQPNDSGISLAEESSIVLASDSGISLAPDSSSKVGGKGKKGAKAPVGSDDLTGTIPLMNVPVSESEDILDTQMEVPMLGDSGDDSSVIEGGRGDTTSVITLDEDEEHYDVTSESGDDLFGAEEAEEADEALEVSDELEGEDDELGDDVFGAEDEDFAGDVESGESLSELPVAGSRGVAAPVEQDWGVPTFVGLTISAVLMLACGTVMFDLVRNMWLTSVDTQNPVSSMLLDMVKGIGA